MRKTNNSASYFAHYLTTRQTAYSIMFPIAAIYAGFAILLSVYVRHYGSERLSGLLGLHHGHEMLFGFALLLVAGYLLGNVARWRIVLFCFIWLGARLFYMTDPQGFIGHGLTIIFGLLLAWEVAPKFLVAKKWRNKMLSPLLIAIGCFPVIFVFNHYLLNGSGTRESLHGMLILLSLLMAYMGGRMIAPAVANEFQKQGIELQARLQPQVEAAFIILLPLALLMSLIPLLKPLSGIALILTGLALFIRLLRWRIWHCFYRSDLLGLSAGYAWLGIGLICLGIAFLANYHITAAIHVITIGAIGTLSAVVMLRVHYQRQYRTLPDRRPVLLAVVLIAIATIARVLGGILIIESLLVIAALAWGLSYLLVAYWLLKSKSSAQV